MSRNADIFAVADLAIGIDMLERIPAPREPLSTGQDNVEENMTMPPDIEFVTAISASSCVFRLKGPASTSSIPNIIASARAALEAASSSALFVLSGCVSFSLYSLFCLCSVGTNVPFVPVIGSVLYLQLLLPMIGLSMSMRRADNESMTTVPPKNDESLTFAKNEGFRLYSNSFIQALLPAVLPQILHLICFGELMIKFEPDLVRATCGTGINQGDWVLLVRCDGLAFYSGMARTMSGTIVAAVMMVCIIISSASFIHRTRSVLESPPWAMNPHWVGAVVASIITVAVYLVVALERGTFADLPWYFYLLALIMPFLCLLGNEMVKRIDSKHIKRAVMLRRLQFETRLGMWSPK